MNETKLARVLQTGDVVVVLDHVASIEIEGPVVQSSHSWRVVVTTTHGARIVVGSYDCGVDFRTGTLPHEQALAQRDFIVAVLEGRIF